MSTNLNMNKMAAAIVLAGLIGMVSAKATEFLYDGGPQHAGAHHDEKRGYAIEVTEVATTGGAAAPAGAADISALYPTADAAAGGEYFAKKCAVCHSIDAGGPNKVGPNLHGVLGRQVASHSGFSYSKAMQSHGDRQWSWDELNHFLFNPKKWVPGTVMAYAGTRKDSERANLIVYLNSQGSNQPLPPVTTPEEAPADDAAAAEGEAPKADAEADAKADATAPDTTPDTTAAAAAK